jgi:hypothetical protein
VLRQSAIPDLQYYDAKGGRLLGQLSLNSQVAVTVQPEGSRKTGKSASSEWRFEVSIPGRSMLVAAPTEQVRVSSILYCIHLFIHLS